MAALTLALPTTAVAATHDARPPAVLPGPGGPELRLRVVGTLEDGGDVARAMNKHGDVPFRTAQGEPMVWNAVTGKQRALAGAPLTAPTDIADDGRVVGVRGVEGVVLWNADGTVTTPGLPPGEMWAGTARLGADGTLLVTASHQFIGWPGGHPRVATSYYLWRPGTGFQHLAGPNDGAYPWALNDKGLVVGTKNDAGTAWRPDGTVATYAGSVPGTTRTWLHGVNNDGVAVGGELHPDGTAAAIRWDAPDTPRRLPDEGSGGQARNVNDRGWVTGVTRATDGTGPTDHPVVWDPDGGLHRIDTLLDLPEGSSVQSIEAINDHNLLLLSIRDADSGRTSTLVVQLI
ncbi:hypothetical protein GCM10010218_62790 [Streptomyces mashuensis]|uniref:Uncharacterized protein n=1 Tax=Streptomyces mashuensis TaxID=33904 RepID=A0A919B9V2_9ACTN|nr:hypothetical protein GCM10010218_62790 [Streptomyces mashuensis]